MYLHYYFYQTYVGVMDIEAYFDMQKKANTLIVTSTEDCDLLLGSLELVYGRKIKRVDPMTAYDQVIHRMGSMPLTNLFTTKKAGKKLTWDDRNRKLCV